MRRITMGILAHVDAGKTTLSEAILYKTNEIRTYGSVDKGDTTLDYDETEKARGITIYSSLASFEYNDVSFSLVDTPGHSDFSAETERTLGVLDLAILVISGTDGIQSHTRTLFSLLKSMKIPVTIFVNKMDISMRKKEDILAEIKEQLGITVLDMTDPDDSGWMEDAAQETEELTEKYLEAGFLDDSDVEKLLRTGKAVPLIFGSAREQEHVDRLLEVVERFNHPIFREDAFGARVYKILRDEKDDRLTFLKLSGGKIKVRQEISDGEKINEIRLYRGSHFQNVTEAEAGQVVAVTGLSKTRPGQGLGFEEDMPEPVLRPVISYRILPENKVSTHTLYEALKKIEETDPLLSVSYKLETDEIRVSLMGSIQKEILSGIIKSRYNIDTNYDAGRITYMETIGDETEGHGHFEPLRHYADVRLRLIPGQRGSSVTVRSELSLDELDENYQNQIKRRIERGLVGILTGSALTDIEFVIVGGKSHKKHTSGGDFNRAVDIAVRDALIRGQNILLEPVYKIMLEVPTPAIGRALTDIQKMHGSVGTPVNSGDMSVIEGTVPVSLLGDYVPILNSYTNGMGRMSVEPGGYMEAFDTERIVEEMGYDYRKDPDHPYESIYVHGSNPDDYDAPVINRPDAFKIGKKDDKEPSYSGMGGLEPELEAIFEKTYGKIDRNRDFEKRIQDYSLEEEPDDRGDREPDKYELKKLEKARLEAERSRKSYVLVDGYNVIFNWEDLNDLSKSNLEAARSKLVDIMSNYQGYTGADVTVVFDAYRVKGQESRTERRGNVTVEYTAENQTADAFLEKKVHDIMKGGSCQVTVVTSDGWVQRIVLGEGALRMSARELRLHLDSLG